MNDNIGDGSLNIRDWGLEIIERTVNSREFAQRYVDVDKFIGYCRQCRHYGKNWSCPGFDFSPYDIWKRYRNFYITAHVVKIPKVLSSNVKSDEELFSLVDNIYTEIKENLTLYLIKKRGNEEGIILGGGHCNFCRVCMREKGLNCIKPELMAYSIESLGGDVTRTLREILGKEIKWPEKGKLPEYFVSAGGILTDSNLTAEEEHDR